MNKMKKNVFSEGSQNVFTGPSRDFTSFGQNEQLGGFVYIDASYPRRPGDRASFISPLLTATGL
jgi:hypothetical protein